MKKTKSTRKRYNKGRRVSNMRAKEPTLKAPKLPVKKTTGPKKAAPVPVK